MITIPLQEIQALRAELSRAHDELFEAAKIIAGRDLPATGRLFELAAARIASTLNDRWCVRCGQRLTGVFVGAGHGEGLYAHREADPECRDRIVLPDTARTRRGDGIGDVRDAVAFKEGQ